ncbi:MAG: hypothetical protein J0H49_38080 [Acidobacteria bacterium]|nr:hypothetical protein [Acidobacteriota bacterium]
MPALAGTVSTYFESFGSMYLGPPGFSGTLTKTSYFQGFDSFGVTGSLRTVRIEVSGGAGISASQFVCQDMDVAVAGRLTIFSAFDCGAQSDSGSIDGHMEFTDPRLLALFQPARVGLVRTWNISADLWEEGYADLHAGFTGTVEYEYGPVPEPAQRWLLGPALTAFWFWRRRGFSSR